MEKFNTSLLETDPSRQPPPQAEPTPEQGPWRISPKVGDVIISEAPGAPEEEQGYYGGHFVCESVDPRYRDIISAAPALRQAATLHLSALTGFLNGTADLALLLSTAERLEQVLGGIEG